MRCSKCGMDNNAAFNFCASCGAKLEKSIVCPNCKTENENTSKYCKNCGKELENFSITSNANTPGVRKSIKRNAREKSKSSIILTFLSMFGVGIILFFMLISGSAIFNENVAFTWFFVIILVVYILSLYIVKFGTTIASLNLARGDDVTVGDTLTYGFNNIIGVVRTVGASILFTVCTSVIGIFPFVGTIAAFAFIIYMAPVLVVFGYLQADNKQGNITFTDALQRALGLCDGKRVAYYGLIISFIGWYLLGFATLGIAFIWVIPYIKISLANYYRMLIGEKNFDNSEAGLSNVSVIALGAISYIFVIIIFTISIIIVTFVTLGEPRGSDYSNFIDEYYDRV